VTIEKHGILMRKIEKVEILNIYIFQNAVKKEKIYFFQLPKILLH